MMRLLRNCSEAGDCSAERSSCSSPSWSRQAGQAGRAFWLGAVSWSERIQRAVLCFVSSGWSLCEGGSYYMILLYSILQATAPQEAGLSRLAGNYADLRARIRYSAISHYHRSAAERNSGKRPTFYACRPTAVLLLQ